MPFGWIEAAIRYAGRFSAPEKRAYQQVFDLSLPTVSRHQKKFVSIMEDACRTEIFERNRGGRLQGGALYLKDDAALPGNTVFDRVPSAERWLEDALGHRHYQAFEITRAPPDPAILRSLVRAIQDRNVIGIKYHSRRGMSQRSVSPYFIVKVAGRMHIRGWDHDYNSARDFVITRIASIWPVQSAFVSPLNDRDWLTFSRIRIEDLRSESKIVREGIRRDFGLNSEGWRMLRVRKPLVSYLVHDIEEGFQSPVKISEGVDVSPGRRPWSKP